MLISPQSKRVAKQDLMNSAKGLINESVRKTERILVRSLRLFSPVLAAKVQQYFTLGTWPNIKNPKDFNEKLHWLNFSMNDPLMTACGEKFDVRTYATQCGCDELLNDVYGLYRSVDEIDWASLPNQFVLKCTHGCSFNLICLDKDTINQNEVKKKLNKWLKKDFSKYLNERHYAGMPRRILCEKYLGMGAGKLPWDYKVYCFHGQPKLVLVVKNREVASKYGIYDAAWQKVPILSAEDSCEERMEKPHCLAEMLKHASTLSKPFHFVRVDFYEVEGKLILGEMTFTPSGCMEDYTREGLQLMGEMLDLSSAQNPPGKDKKERHAASIRSRQQAD
jgi:hypothetical protein